MLLQLLIRTGSGPGSANNQNVASVAVQVSTDKLATASTSSETSRSAARLDHPFDPLRPQFSNRSTRVEKEHSKWN